MIITVLIENTSLSDALTAEHGLALFIETEKHRIICDCGQTDAFIKNAGILGADIKKADTVILSHAHYDHSGGILALAGINREAVIYLPPFAGEDYYAADGRYIGIDKKILSLKNKAELNGTAVIDDEITVFGSVGGREFFPFGNKTLLKVENGEKKPDDFLHEQYTVINSAGKTVLISGCAHNGIINILERYKLLFGSLPDAVVSGFHLMKHGKYTDEEISFIKETAKKLMKYDTVFYTGHCTGDAMPYLEEIMGDKVRRIQSGSVITL